MKDKGSYRHGESAFFVREAPSKSKINWPAPVYGENWDQTMSHDSSMRHYDPLTDEDYLKRLWLSRILLLTSQ